MISSRKEVKKTVSGVCVKLGTIVVLLLIFFVLPVLLFNNNETLLASWLIYCPLVVEGIYSGLFSLIGVFRLIKYHR